MPDEHHKTKIAVGSRLGQRSSRGPAVREMSETRARGCRPAPAHVPASASQMRPGAQWNEKLEMKRAIADELRAAYRTANKEAARSVEGERRRVEAERAATPFGRCVFSDEPLPDPGELSYAQAETRFGWAPCQVRYGRWPNGARVEYV